MRAQATFALLLLLVSGPGCSQEPGPQAPAAPSELPQSAPSPPHYGIEIIDSHVHIEPDLAALALALDVLEGSGIRRFVAKSAGAWGTPRFAYTLAMKGVLGDRFEFFCNIDWDAIDDADFVSKTVEGLSNAAAAGARGVKIFKNLGLRLRTADGKLVPVDDPRLDPIFDAAGKMGLIVAIHVADPVAFFEPVTPDNERFDELSIASGWSFHGGDFPKHADLMAQQERRIARHPATKFLLIHMGNNAEDLGYVDRILDRYPNVWTDTSARIPEFGRHPADKVRAFFIKHQDRILFGSDLVVTTHGLQLGSVSPTPPTVRDGIRFFQRHWEYFETDLRQIDHPTPIQGRWKVDAVDLPPEVLRKLYRDNVLKLVFDASPK